MREYRALLRECRALLRECRALLSDYMALLREFRALLSGYMALFETKTLDRLWCSVGLKEIGLQITVYICLSTARPYESRETI